MFKRKLLVIIIPVLATSVLVGAGFGAWYFDSSYIRLEKSLGVKVEDKVETFGFIETSLPGDTVLKIDQGGFFFFFFLYDHSSRSGKWCGCWNYLYGIGRECIGQTQEAWI